MGITSKIRDTSKIPLDDLRKKEQAALEPLPAQPGVQVAAFNASL